MAHYICNGSCKGEADRPGVCQADSCERKGEALEECDCADGLHGREIGEERLAGDDAPVAG